MCAFCDAAKRLLTKKNIPYKEINVALEERKMEEMIKKSNGKRTIPQIFIEDYHVGGYEELRALENKGELDKITLFNRNCAYRFKSNHKTSGTNVHSSNSFLSSKRNIYSWWN
jgi:glutaredoxin 3